VVVVAEVLADVDPVLVVVDELEAVLVDALLDDVVPVAAELVVDGEVVAAEVAALEACVF
jgi:hypothetical protein